MFRFILFAYTLFCYYLATAQPQQDIYNQAINEINCITIKTLLISYDRPVSARMIQTCNYESITRAIDKVQENTIKGYKKMILETAQSINLYKSKVVNPTEYTLFEAGLEEAQALALRRYEEVCNKNKGANSTVCVNMEQKSLKLQSELNGIVSEALPKIAKQTYGGEKTPNPAKTEKPAAADVAPQETESSVKADEIPKGEYNNGAEPEISTGGSGSSIWSMLGAVVMVGLIAAVAWLFKENRELREKMDDISMLLKMLNQKK